MANVRAEAAQRRIELRDKTAEHAEAAAQVTSLTEAKTAVEADLTTARGELARLRAAIAAGVPVDRVETVAARLIGSTDAELAADAQSVAALLSPAAPAADPAVDPSQGHGDDAPALTPADAFAEVLREQFEALKR